MRALRYDAFGPPSVLRIADVAEPVPRAGELLVRVRAAGLNPLDWKIRAGHLRFVPGLARPPRGLGIEFAGDVVGVGGGTMGSFPGQRVFGTLPPLARQGALAECVTVAAALVAPVPAAIAYAAAAALPVAAGTAVQALADHARIEAGQRVLVTGAAGGVGHFAVQYAKHAGAHVTGVCGADNVEFVRAQGADAVIDYAVADWTRGDDRYDVVFDAVGRSGYFAARRVLLPGGIYLDTSPSATVMMRTLAARVVAGVGGGPRAQGVVLRAAGSAWERLARLAADGVLRPHIARTIGLSAVAAAQAAMETGHGRGKIVVEPTTP